MNYKRRADADNDYPIFIEAFQWQPSMGEVGGVTMSAASDTTGAVETPEGVMLVEPGDWVVTYQDNTLDVWDNATFVAAYEPVGEPLP